MEKQMVNCEDGRRRQARVYGHPTENGQFEIQRAGVRLKGKHITGEAWYSRNTGLWYFLTDPECKHSKLLPRRNERPKEPERPLQHSPSVKTR